MMDTPTIATPLSPWVPTQQRTPCSHRCRGAVASSEPPPAEVRVQDEGGGGGNWGEGGRGWLGYMRGGK